MHWAHIEMVADNSVRKWSLTLATAVEWTRAVFEGRAQLWIMAAADEEEEEKEEEQNVSLRNYRHACVWCG